MSYFIPEHAAQSSLAQRISAVYMHTRKGSPRSLPRKLIISQIRPPSESPRAARARTIKIPRSRARARAPAGKAHESGDIACGSLPPGSREKSPEKAIGWVCRVTDGFASDCRFPFCRINSLRAASPGTLARVRIVGILVVSIKKARATPSRRTSGYGRGHRRWTARGCSENKVCGYRRNAHFHEIRERVRGLSFRAGEKAARDEIARAGRIEESAVSYGGFLRAAVWLDMADWRGVNAGKLSASCAGQRSAQGTFDWFELRIFASGRMESFLAFDMGIRLAGLSCLLFRGTHRYFQFQMHGVEFRRYIPRYFSYKWNKKFFIYTFYIYIH